VLTQDLSTQETGSFHTQDQVGFALPARESGMVLGVGNEIFLIHESGKQEFIAKCEPLLQGDTLVRVKWNDAKVAPGGELFAGSMDYNGEVNAGALYKVSNNHKFEIIISPVTISNGLDWNVEGTRFFYIDTPTFRVDSFEYSVDGIRNPNVFIELDGSHGVPDGMCADSENGLWIAYFGGQRIERYSNRGKLTHTLEIPVKNPTSCCFAGKNLESLIITTAKLMDTDNPLSGMTFIVETGFVGQGTRLFN
jgi:sugar lactone lactonase YvrE